MINHLFCFGLGYTALKLVRTLQKHEPDIWKFSGTKQTPIAYQDINVYAFNQLELLPPDITHILISIPPEEDGDLVYNKFHTQISNLPYLKWLGYFSTTGVYGNYDGAWVDESSDTITNDHRSLLRLKAETQWLSLTKAFIVNILRLSAIYGPHRNELEKILAGIAHNIVKPNHFFSRIHVSDIIQMVIACIKNATETQIYNLSDDYPSTPQEVLEYACQLLKTQPPAVQYFEDITSERMKSFYSSSKKVNNNKVKQHFKLKLIYPSYKEGLNHIFQELSYTPSYKRDD